jgi:hypothetical protein
VGPRRVGIIALGIAACAGHATAPAPSAQLTARPTAPDKPVPVVVPEQTVEPRLLESPTYVGTGGVGPGVPWPSPTAPLATGAGAAAIAALAKPAFAARDADAPRGRLLAALDAHPDRLTADGLYLRAVLTALDDEARGAAALDRDPDAREDYKRTIAATAQFLGRFADDVHAPEAHYLHGWATLETDASLAAAQELLAVATGAPDRDIAIDADLGAADYYFLHDGGHDALVLAAQAYGALVDSALPRADKFRALALERLGVVLTHLGDLPNARARLCALHAMPKLEYDAETRLIGTFDDTHDVETLRAACDARACPCFAPVVQAVAELLVSDDDPARARVAIDLLLAHFPDSPRAAELRCARAALDDTTVAGCPPPDPIAGSDVDRAVHELHAARGVRTCLERAWRATRRMPDGEGTFEITVGARGAATAVHAPGSLPPELNACVVEALGRHRWRGLDGRVLTLPIDFGPP